MFKHILIPTDGDPGSKRAAQVGIELARQLKAEVTFFHAMTEFAHASAVAELLEPPPDELLADAQSHAAKLLAPLRRMAKESSVTCHLETKLSEDPHKAILAAAKKAKCDLIVMASRKRSGIAKLVLGSVAQKVVGNSSLPVLVVN